MDDVRLGWDERGECELGLGICLKKREVDGEVLSEGVSGLRDRYFIVEAEVMKQCLVNDTCNGETVQVLHKGKRVHSVGCERFLRSQRRRRNR